MDDLFSVLSDARRREILKQLAGGELSAGEVRRAHPSVTFGAISQHLKVLERAGLVRMRQAGRNRFYETNLEALLPLRQWLDWMWDKSLNRLKQLAESEATTQFQSTDTQEGAHAPIQSSKSSQRKLSSRTRPSDRRAP